MSIWSTEIKDLEKLYDSFKGRYPKLDKELEKLIITDDENMVLIYARRCLEVIITDLCERELKRDRGTEPLKGIIDKLNREKKVPHNIIVSMQNLNSLSTFGAHPKDFDPIQVKTVLLDLNTTLNWYLKYMETQPPTETESGVPGEIRKEPAGAKKVTASSKKRILLASAIVLVCVVIVVSLILTDVINGGKGVKAGEIKSLVVLPFENYTGADTLEYFVSGMHSSLIQDMGRISSLLIPGSTTSKAFKGADKTIAQITSELHVDAALETSVVCLGEDTICLQTRLIKPGMAEKKLWIADYKVERSQILNLYNQITRQVAEEVKVTLTPEEKDLLTKTRTVDRKAYEEYLKARSYWDDFSRESLCKALDYLNSATEKEPDWAPLYTGLANVWIGIQQAEYEPPSVASPKIYENLNKAIELDPDLSDSHYLFGLIAHVMEWNWEKSEREFLKALAINPSDAVSRIFYAQLLMVLQRNDEALTQGKLAMSLDPLNPVMKWWYSALLSGIGDCKTPLAIMEEIVAADPENYMANGVIELAAFQCKEYDKVIKAVRYSLPFPIEEDTFKEIERIYGEHGIVSAYEEIMKQMEAFASSNPIPPMDMAMRYIMANQLDKAMDWIEKGFEMHDPQITYITTHLYNLDPLFKNPRFIAIVKKINLPLPNN